MRSRKTQSRNAQIVRILGVLRDLDRLGGTDRYELAQRYGTNERTIRRDLEALQEAGIPLVEEERDGKRKRWRVAFRERLSRELSGLLDASHYLALRLAMGQGGPARRLSTVFASLEDLSDKIEKALGKAERARLAAIDACFLSYEKFAYEKSPPDVFWPLVGAIAEGRLCRVRYRAPRVPPATKTFEVLPIKLFVHGGAVYLLCGVPKHGSVVTLNLQRLLELTVLARRGEPPADFDLARWEASAFGVFSGGPQTTFRLRFSPAAAPYVRERIWHPSQKLDELADGRVDLEFTCGDSLEVDAWVASWRTAVEVLAPRRLRADLARLGAWLSGTYGEPRLAAARPGRLRAERRGT